MCVCVGGGGGMEAKKKKGEVQADSKVKTECYVILKIRKK